MLMQRSHQLSYETSDGEPTLKLPAPTINGFIAQSVRVSHRHREVTDTNTVEVLKFSGFSTQLLKLRS